MENPNFLKKKYDLHNAPEVASAAKHTDKKTKEKLSQNPEIRIQNYLDRLERLALDPKKEQPKKMFDGEPRPRALLLLREMVMNKYVRPHQEKLAEGAARVEEQAARNMGIEAHYGAEELEERGEIAVEDLEKSLDNWISYLSDANEPYPTWFRYYAFRNILDLGDYDKDKREFTKRSLGTIRLFPEIDRGALAYVQEMIEAASDPIKLEQLSKAQETLGTPEDQLITKEKAKKFSELSFAKQYAEGIKQAGEITPEVREESRGKWVKYQKDTDPTALWASLQNKGTAWCTKGFATAETQLKGGDFYVYYTLDSQANPTIPRIAIRMQGQAIGEVRGVADSDQNLEGSMIAIAETKMKELPGADKYKKTSADMKLLTQLERKIKQNQPPTKDDLTFLYEINQPIQGFGYQRDPRIKELRDQRSPEQDMLIIFECTQDQIAKNTKEINENTKAYLGKLEPGIFTVLQKYNIENVYTSFPEGKIKRQTIEIGGRTGKELEKELRDNKINFSSYAKDMLRSKDFVASKTKEQIPLVRLRVKDLGFTKNATTKEIYQRAQELGLELCSPDTGPNYRLQYKDQPLGEWFYIGMKQITDSDGDPSVFRLVRSGDGIWLGGPWAEPVGEWSPVDEFVFSLRKFRKET